ncbi:hypothetical protein G7Y89_g9976 [Cudoniella acicularis]|uniref:Uncharacterized protein n=1 Tax=Cudoniella acicularis TaxID=354080 RepID=A0A8H4RDM2_9HELO|nr:hypothetical protein G7Y89_g9976 [Cudoniella acicularis]
MKRSVKDSPFLIADKISSGRNIPLLPKGHKRGTPERSHPDTGTSHRQRLNTSSEYEDCDSPGCRATHNGHKPYRHSIKCIEKTHLQEETDNGYVADTSRFEDPTQPSSFFSQSNTSRSQSHLSYGMTRPTSATSYTNNANSTIKNDQYDYVECHGYPRTSHELHGSGNPISTGVVGECQHCFDDCHCAACQSTHHSVRCCLHKDHQAILHHHESPPDEVSCFDSELPATLARTSGMRLVGTPTRTVDTVIPPGRRKKTPVPAQLEDSVKPSSYYELTTKPLVDTTRSLSTEKKSALFKEESEAPTPPPWVSLPRDISKSVPSRTPKENMARRGREALTSTTPTVSTKFVIKGALPPSMTSNKSTFPLIVSRAETETLTQMEKSNMHAQHGPASRRHSYIGHDTVSFSRGNTRRIGSVSTQGSMKALRKISSLFQLREKNSISLLNQRLLEHQEDLRHLAQECESRANALPSGEGGIQETDALKRQIRIRQAERPASENSDGSKAKKRLRLRAAGPRPNSVAVSEKSKSSQSHVLSDEETLFEEQNEIVSMIAFDSWVGLPDRPQEPHECIWKRLFLDEQIGKEEYDGSKEKDCGVKGVTVLIHFEGRADMVLKADLRGSGRLAIARV